MGWRIGSALLVAASLAAQVPINSIAVEGNKTLDSSAILRATGLRAGDFDAARDRLLASGYFDAVSYRYKPAATGGYEITFTVKESDALYPIRVDALGVTTEEIAAVVKAHDPLFSGKLPGTKEVLDRTAREIERYLGTKQQPAAVGARVIAVGPGQFEIEFTPARGLPAVSTVTFEGTKIFSAAGLRSKVAEAAFGQSWTEESFRGFSEDQINPWYEAKGYMHVTFPKIVSTPSKDVQGVDVHATVDEGDQYQLSKVTVGGSMAGDSERILKIARITGFDELRAGAGRVKDSMRHQGYLDAEVTTENKRDDEKKTVEFTIVVEAGPVYKMGKLSVLGLALDGEAAIHRMWAVKSGDSFPAEYPTVFVKRVKEDNLFNNLGEVKADSQIDKASHIASVTIDFKSASKDRPQTRRGPGR